MAQLVYNNIKNTNVTIYYLRFIVNITFSFFLVESRFTFKISIDK